MTEDLRDVYSKAVNAIIQAREENGLMLNGKVYSMVKDRVEAFRAYFGFAYGIDTSVDYTHGFTRGSMIVAVAKIIDNATGHIIASGHAMEWVGNGISGPPLLSKLARLRLSGARWRRSVFMAVSTHLPMKWKRCSARRQQGTCV